MVSPELAGAVTGVCLALLAGAVGAAGGWRNAPPGDDGPVPELAPSEPGIPASLVDLGWRFRIVAELYRAALLVVLGLTPLGARFVHLLAPAGTHWRVAAAMLIILMAAGVVPRLLAMWWLRLARAACPALIRPRVPGRKRLRRLLSAGCLVAVILADVAVNPNLFSGGLLVVMLLAFFVAGVLQAAVIVRRLGSLPKPERLATALDGLPRGRHDMTVTVGAAWRTPLANAVATSSFTRGAIVIAPPLLDALTDAQLRAVVAHELRHVRNRDTLWRLLRVLLMLLVSAATALALYAIPALRRLAGVHVSYLTGQALPLLLAVAYLAWKVLRVAELRARRAEEAAADRSAVELTDDPRAVSEAMAVLGSMLGTPESLTLPRRLLTATHPATGERLRLVSALSSGDASPGQAPGDGSFRQAIATLAVIAIAAGPFALASSASAGPPPNLGAYRVVPPPRFGNGVLTSHLGSSVWRYGIERFGGAVPVEAVYDQGGQPWLYVWGAEGRLTDPSGALAAFWKASDPLAGFNLPLVADAEPAGPLGGDLQCELGTNTCAWADYSGIVVVSLSAPGNGGVAVTTGDDADPGSTEQALAELAKSFRGKAELPR